jgi:hypothetical protein
MMVQRQACFFYARKFYKNMKIKPNLPVSKNRFIFEQVNPLLEFRALSRKNGIRKHAHEYCQLCSLNGCGESKKATSTTFCGKSLCEACIYYTAHTGAQKKSFRCDSCKNEDKTSDCKI